MSEIQTYLDEIRNALYGEEVRSSIVNAINQCYQDAASGITPEIDFTQLSNGTRVNISVGGETNSFDVVNGARPIFYTKTYVTQTITAAAGAFGTTSVTIDYPEGYTTQVAILGTGANGSPITSYTTASGTNDGEALIIYFQNPTENTVQFSLRVDALYMRTIEEASGDEVVLERMYPVGSVYISTNSTNPSLLFGGTWRAIGQGRTLIGVGSIEANTVDTYGTVTADEFSPAVNDKGGSVSHNHAGRGSSGTLSAAIGAVDSDDTRIGYTAGDKQPGGDGPASATYAIQGSSISGSKTFSHYTPVYGHTDNSPSLQPYLAVYIWERTA